MAGVTGTGLYLLFDGSTLSTDFRSFSASEEIGVVDQSAGADANRTYLTELKDGSASATIVIQSADTATWGVVAVGEEGSLEWGREGTVAAKPRSYANAIVTSREKTVEYDDLVVADIEWQFSGAVTDTTY